MNIGRNLMQDISAIDWNEAWKELDRQKKAKADFASCAERWSDSERCRKFNRMVQEDNWKDAWERVHAMKCTPSSRVLDIGAGPGTLAIPLSGIVRQVTAVEPSPGMLECLYENIEQREIHNITTIRKKWEDVDPEMDLNAPYDVVVASYSLGVPDLRAALEKMDAVSEKYVYIFWFADMMSPRHRNYLEIWEDLFGVSPPAGRMPNIIFNLLNQMGIYASVEISRTGHITRFPGLEEAVADQRDFLKLKDERQVSVLRNYLQKILHYENGQYVMKGTSYQAKIWWEKDA
jgi:ubiquinone/menaquinone biosynthesis C-methylase UbiE